VRRERRGEPERVGALVPRLLRELGLDAASLGVELARRWSAVVGEEAAAHSRPTGLRAGVLEITADSSVWSQQLQLCRPQILAALQRELGERAPTDLWLRVG
jgi:predicted nucleic acid-binding Zn ribbon protein